jgi:hypothetical protein
MAIDALALSQFIEEFIASSPSAAVLEGGEVIFDLCDAKYSCSSEHGRCLLHLWSPERNAVRRVLDAEQKCNTLRLQVQRFGQPKPSILEIVRDRERRTPAAQKQARDQYQRLLERVLSRSFPDLTALPFTNKTDLEKSFGPVYSRGMMRRGRSAWACLGVNEQEQQAAIDGALTTGLLWLDHLRERYMLDYAIEGLKLFVPPKSSQVIRLRAAQLSPAHAKIEVWEFDQREGALQQKDIFDRGNIATRLVRCIDQDRVREKFSATIRRMRQISPQCENVVTTGGELSFRIHGVEFARAQTAYLGDSLTLAEQIVFGVGPSTTTLTEDNEALFQQMVRRLQESRGEHNLSKNPLWRMLPERWLESVVGANVTVLDERLSNEFVYSQVPAFSSSDRAIIDLLCMTRDSQLAVIELKADEDIHLPMQGLDYWSRVRYHQERGEFAQYGYFGRRALSDKPPLLLLVAPALHLHPSTDKLLRYIDPKIDCTVIGLDERWRQEVRVVFRKRANHFGACPL